MNETNSEEKESNQASNMAASPGMSKICALIKRGENGRKASAKFRRLLLLSREWIGQTPEYCSTILDLILKTRNDWFLLELLKSSPLGLVVPRDLLARVEAHNYRRWSRYISSELLSDESQDDPLIDPPEIIGRRGRRQRYSRQGQRTRNGSGKMSQIGQHESFHESRNIPSFCRLVSAAGSYPVDFDLIINGRTLFEHLLENGNYKESLIMIQNGCKGQTCNLDPFLYFEKFHRLTNKIGVLGPNIHTPVCDNSTAFQVVKELLKIRTDSMPLNLSVWLEPLFKHCDSFFHCCTSSLHYCIDPLSNLEKNVTDETFQDLTKFALPPAGKTSYSHVFLRAYIEAYLESESPQDASLLYRVAKGVTIDQGLKVIYLAKFSGNYERKINLMRVCHNLPVITTTGRRGKLCFVPPCVTNDATTIMGNSSGYPWETKSEMEKAFQIVKGEFRGELIPDDYRLLPCFLQEIITVTTCIWHLGKTYRSNHENDRRVDGLVALGCLPVEMLFHIFGFLASPSKCLS